jgi:hypothetical protein
MREARSAVTPQLIVAVTLLSGNASATQLPPPQTIAAHALEDEAAIFSTGPRHSSDAAVLDRLRMDAIDELHRYLAFGAGWDGYDGQPFTAKTVALARSIIDRLYERLTFAGVIPTEIAPGPIADGRIDIEVVVDGRQLILTIDPDEDLISISHQERHGDHEGLAQSDEQGVDGWLDWVVGTLRMPSLVREASVHSAF